ncbi:MAG TPA: 3-dehydroquinate synthase II [Methanothrix sp.]|jgi:3-dehydroquinate synthase II|nr:3-dehydroquinate synthase II [Methanothrix sp.]HQJ78899.1 3-dehydroquinate synthase II [Methanothrix sp.]
MKEKWLMALGGWEEIKPRITTALESGFDCVLVERENIDRVRELGRIKVACFGGERGSEDILVVGSGGEGDGTVALPKDPKSSLDGALARSISGTKAAYVVISGKKYEEFAVEMGRMVDYLLVIGTDWKVIPLENMIAGLQGSSVKIISGVRTAEEAALALTTLEKGSAGVLLDSTDPSEIKRVMAAVEQSEKGRMELLAAKVTAVKPVGMGDRVCVDTASMMSFGEGMLIGSQAKGFFLVHSESEDSPYVASRPFRVNAGAVHAYIRVGEKTRYLSELKSGDEVTIVSKEGLARPAIVGRAKIEKRPMMLIEAEASGQRLSTLLQNAETIKLVSPEGQPRAVTDLKVGDEVLVHLEEGARHFGMKIEESIVEK